MTRALLILVAVLVGLLGWSMFRAEQHKGTAEAAVKSAQDAAESAKQLRQTLEAERADAKDMNAIGDTHERDREVAQGVPQAVVDELRAGTVRLRREWAGCETARLSDTAASTVERDALAASRDALAGAIVRVGRDADDQLRACQAIVAADRERMTP